MTNSLKLLRHIYIKHEYSYMTKHRKSIMHVDVQYYNIYTVSILTLLPHPLLWESSSLAWWRRFYNRQSIGCLLTLKEYRTGSLWFFTRLFSVVEPPHLLWLTWTLVRSGESWSASKSGSLTSVFPLVDSSSYIVSVSITSSSPVSMWQSDDSEVSAVAVVTSQWTSSESRVTTHLGGQPGPFRLWPYQ